MKAISPVNLVALSKTIKDSVGEARFDLWFNGNTKLTLEGDSLLVGVPNRFFRDWLETNFESEIRHATEKVFGNPLSIRFRIDPALFQKARESELTPTPVKPSLRTTPAVTEKPVSKMSRYLLKKLVVGSSNRVAVAAANSFAEDPRKSYSPLYLHGATGLGKTHLLKGLEDEIKHRHPQIRVLCLSCEEFTNQFLESLQHKTVMAFRKKFRHLDVLLLDDAQFLNNKKATQEELLHTLKALENRGGKVMITSDVHPRRLAKVSEELRTRFVAGMVAKLDPPTKEMRIEIITAKAERRNLRLTPNVIDFLAENLRNNVCEIEGVLNYLGHCKDTFASTVELSAARDAVGEILRHQSTALRVNDLRRIACELYGLDPKTLRRRSKVRSVSHPRMLILYLARKFTQSTYTQIGQAVGGLDHSTVIAAEKKIEALIKKDAEIVLGDRPWRVREAVEAFQRELGRA